MPFVNYIPGCLTLKMAGLSLLRRAFPPITDLCRRTQLPESTNFQITERRTHSGLAQLLIPESETDKKKEGKLFRLGLI